MTVYRTFPCPPRDAPGSCPLNPPKAREWRDRTPSPARGNGRFLELGRPAGGGEHVGEAGQGPAPAGGVHEEYEAEHGRGVGEYQGVAAELAEQHERVVGPDVAGAARRAPVLGPERAVDAGHLVHLGGREVPPQRVARPFLCEGSGQLVTV